MAKFSNKIRYVWAIKPRVYTETGDWYPYSSFHISWTVLLCILKFRKAPKSRVYIFTKELCSINEKNQRYSINSLYVWVDRISFTTRMLWNSRINPYRFRKRKRKSQSNSTLLYISTQSWPVLGCPSILMFTENAIITGTHISIKILEETQWKLENEK